LTTFSAQSTSRAVTSVDVTVRPSDAGLRLDVIVARDLAARLNRPLSKSSVRRLIMAGAVRLSGRPLRRPGYVLEAGERLDVLVDLSRLDALERRTAGRASLTAADILYEDDDLVAVSKPAGLQVHPSADPARDDLFSAVKRLLACRDVRHRGQGGRDPYLGIHQRLDVDTSGCVLFTKSERANPGIGAQFEKHSVEKVYHALVVRPSSALPADWVSTSRVARVGRGRRARVEAVRTGGQEAETAFSILESTPAVLLIEARPKTGRTHQIRAHLAEAGAPIFGDERYGAPTALSGCQVARTMLHASRLALEHPVTGARLVIECSYPRDFRHALESLRRASSSPARQRRG
jgi:23S rRNA pseudouridine1911/1915/1917 synthase